MGSATNGSSGDFCTTSCGPGNSATNHVSKHCATSSSSGDFYTTSSGTGNSATNHVSKHCATSSCSGDSCDTGDSATNNVSKHGATNSCAGDITASYNPSGRKHPRNSNTTSGNCGRYGHSEDSDANCATNDVSKHDTTSSCSRDSTTSRICGRYGHSGNYNTTSGNCGRCGYSGDCDATRRAVCATRHAICASRHAIYAIDQSGSDSATAGVQVKVLHLQ